MPVYPIQISAPKTRIGLWKITEKEQELRLLIPHLTVPAEITHPDKTLEFLASRILLEKLLPGVSITKNTHGKPITDTGGYASISHTHGWAAACFNPEIPVGLDVEEISSKAFRLKEKFCSPQEWLPLQEMTGYSDSVLFSVIWSVKEAIFKLLPHEGWIFKNHFLIRSFNSKKQSFMAEILSSAKEKRWVSGEFHFVDGIVLVVALSVNNTTD